MHTTCATATTGRRTTVEPHICQPIVWPSVDYFNALPYVNKNLSCRKQIVRQLRRQYVEGIYRPKYHTVTLKTRLSVTQCHWKRYHWIDHTRLTISRVIWHWILSWPWNVCQRSLKVIESGTIWKLGYDFLFAFRGNYGRIFSHFGDIQPQRMAWPWNLGLGLFKVTENGAVR